MDGWRNPIRRQSPSAPAGICPPGEFSRLAAQQRSDRHFSRPAPQRSGGFTGGYSPDSAKPECAKPCSGKPGCAEPGSHKSGSSKPGLAKPSSVESGSAKPGATDPGSAPPESTQRRSHPHPAKKSSSRHCAAGQGSDHSARAADPLATSRHRSRGFCRRVFCTSEQRHIPIIPAKTAREVELQNADPRLRGRRGYSPGRSDVLRRAKTSHSTSSEDSIGRSQRLCPGRVLFHRLRPRTIDSQGIFAGFAAFFRRSRLFRHWRRKSYA